MTGTLFSFDALSRAVGLPVADEVDRLLLGAPDKARPTDPGTSHAAAVSISEEATEASERYVLDVLRKLGPATDERIAAYSPAGWSPSRLRTARAQLVRKGLVRDSGLLGLTRSGRKAIEWEIVR